MGVLPMSKIRVYDLAKMLGKTNPEMLKILAGLGINVKSHMSSIEEEDAQKVKSSLSANDTSAETTVKQHKPAVKKTDADEKKKEHHDKSKTAGEEKHVAPQEHVVTSVSYQVVKIPVGSTVSSLAHAVGEKPGSAVKLLMEAGFMIPATAVADEKIIDILGKGFSKKFVFVEARELEQEKTKAKEHQVAEAEKHAKKKEAKHAEKHDKKPEVEIKKNLKPRPPIITVMGHVDHGKTTLLDNIRNTHVTDREAGGITQHIGASRVEYNGNTLVFLDTPGHEAFTAMRARGAQVTDIAVLVVAADDGIMPQTVEALNHAKAAGVPIVVAVNKIDKPDAKPERVRQQLSDYGLVPEEWGGDTVMVDVAAKSGLHVDQLLEMMLLVAEMQELKADPTAKPEGTVIEANLDKGKGPVATVIVQNGTLHRGDIIHTDTAWGKIRAMIDDKGRNVNSAGPSMPVEILGLENVPQPGEKFSTLSSEREARDIMSRNESERREQNQAKTKRLTLEELYDKMQTEEIPQLRIVLKTDVQGSLEAFHSSLMKMSTDTVSINIVHEGVGRISESDVMLASASNAIVVGFNVRPDNNAKKIAETEGVQIRLYQVIYDMLDDVKAAMEGMLAPELREHTLGQAEIREIFRVPKIGSIAGCRVTDGLVRRGKVRLIRDGVVFWSGELASLKHFKDDVREIKSGNECGLSFEKFQDFKVGDIVESYEVLKEKKTLE
jgi:translation initiation factor IF-2